MYNTKYIKCIYDETEPVGDLGRGTHYSVFTVPDRPDLQRFAVIWDEDHDRRVIDVIEDLYAKDLLLPVLFIGERKGGLSLVVDPSIIGPGYEDRVDAITQEIDYDPWTSEVTDRFDQSCIINTDGEKVAIYLENIRNLWNIGLRPL